MLPPLNEPARGFYPMLGRISGACVGFITLDVYCLIMHCDVMQLRTVS